MEGPFQTTHARRWDALTEERFREAVERYGDTVFRLAYSYLKNRADAEDVMQESLLKLYVEPKEFESADHEKHWLLRVAANECKKLLRSPWRRRTGPLDEAEEAAAFDRPAQSELFRQVMSLPPKYRASPVQTWLMRARGQLHTKLKEAEAL